MCHAGPQQSSTLSSTLAPLPLLILQKKMAIPQRPWPKLWPAKQPPDSSSGQPGKHPQTAAHHSPELLSSTLSVQWKVFRNCWLVSQNVCLTIFPPPMHLFWTLLRLWMNGIQTQEHRQKKDPRDQDELRLSCRIMQLNGEARGIICCWNSALCCRKLLFQNRRWNSQRGKCTSRSIIGLQCFILTPWDFHN